MRCRGASSSLFRRGLKTTAVDDVREARQTIFPTISPHLGEVRHGDALAPVDAAPAAAVVLVLAPAGPVRPAGAGLLLIWRRLAQPGAVGWVGDIGMSL